MPSRAKANTVFFWASVVSTWELSPAVCAAVKSPRRAELTLRSTSSCRDVLRSTATTRTSAFPYWLGPSTIAMRHCCTWNLPGSGPSIGGVRERSEQQRDVVVLRGLQDGEGEHDLRVEGLPALLGEPRPGGKPQPGRARPRRGLGQPAPAVPVGDALGQQVLPGEQAD